jgi:phosphate transport system substrate-binding protein
MVLHMKEWAEKYSPVARASITYQRCGEGLAIDRMLRREFAFAGTVMPVSESQTKAEGVKLSDVVYVPVALGAIVPVFNVPGVSEALKLSPEVLAGIYTGTIRMWNDDAIRKANPDAKLPAANIVVMCRNDKSGSTYVWQDYLCSAAPDVFPQGIKGETPSNGWEWRGPPPLAQFADWSERPGFGVTLPNFSIAYLDLTTAGLSRLSVAQVKSANGDWMLADTTRIATAARNKLLGNDALEGLRFSLVNVPGQNSYPICTIFWVVALANQPKERGGELVKWFKWILGDGQSAVLDQKTATLPRELVGLIGPNLDRIAS